MHTLITQIEDDIRWTHVWAVPCNSIKECERGFDEENCQLPHWVLPVILAGTFGTLCTSLFFYLANHLNFAIRSIKNNINKENIERSPSNRFFQIALMIEQKDYRNIQSIYQKEMDIHGSEAAAICCLKVILPFITFALF